MVKRRVYEILEGGSRGHRLGRVFDLLAVLLIFVSVAAALGSTSATSMRWPASSVRTTTTCTS